MKWVTVAEFARLEGVAKRTIRKRIKSHPTMYRVRQVLSPGGRSGLKYEIALEDNKSAISIPSSLILPPLQGGSSFRAQHAAPLQDDPTGGTANMANPAEIPQWAMEKFQTRKEICDFIKSQKGAACGAPTFGQICQVAGTKFGISARSIERVWYLYNKEGEIGLMPDWGNRAGKSVVPVDMLNRAIALYNQPSKPDFTDVYNVIRCEFKDRVTFSLSAMKRSIRRVNPPILADKGRLNEREWREKYEYFCERDWNSVNFLDFTSWDHRPFDIMVYPDDAKTGKPFRPWLTLGIDVASRMPLGWHIGRDHNTNTILYSLRKTIINFGLPRIVQHDRGLDYKSTAVKFLLENQLKINVTTALPREAQSKPIESWFRYVKRLEKFLPGYCGQNVQHKPDKLKAEIAERRLLSLSELQRTFEEWAETWIRTGRARTGESPFEIWKRSKYETLFDAERVLDILMMEATDRKVWRGATLKIDGLRYRSAELLNYIGETVTAYFDNYAKECQVYFQNEWICTAEIDRPMSPFATREEMKELTHRKAEARREVARYPEAWRMANEDYRTFVTGQHGPIEDEVLEIGVRTRPAPEEPAVERVVSGNRITETNPDGSILQYERDTDPELLAREQDPNARVVRRLPEIEKMVKEKAEGRRQKAEVKKLELDPMAICGRGRRRIEEVEINLDDLLRPRKQ